jgi:hypothetical protein
MWLHTVGYRLRQVRQQLGFVAPLSEEDYQQVARVLPSSAALSLFRSMSPADQQHALRVYRGLQARNCTDTDMLSAALLHDVGKAQNRVPFWTRPAIVLGKKLAPQLLSRLVLYPETGSPSRWDPIMQMNKLTGSSVGLGLRGRRHSDLSHPSPIYRPPGNSTPSPHQFVKPHHRVPRGAGQGPSIVGAMPCARPLPPSARPVPARDFPPTPIPKWRQSLSNAWYHADIGADLAASTGLSERAVLYIRTHHQPDGPAAELHAVDEVS